MFDEGLSRTLNMLVDSPFNKTAVWGAMRHRCSYTHSLRDVASYFDSISPLDLSDVPEKVLLKIFSFLPHRDLITCAYVCRQWRSVAYDSSLWKAVFLRPEHEGLVVKDPSKLVSIFGTRLGESLRDLELPVDLINTEILTELTNKCPNLRMLTLDFSNAMQLCDFNDLNVFPCNLKSMCICLSEVIFLEGFMRRIYTYLSSLNVLHLIGTIEMSNQTDHEVYETISFQKIKSNTPNLRVLNLYGIRFLQDHHVELFISGCIHLECLALNYCTRFEGDPLKIIMSRCRNMRCLLLRNTSIQDSSFAAVNWEETVLEELDIGSTDLSEKCFLESFKRMPGFRYLAVPYCDGFTDQVVQMMCSHDKFTDIRSLDISSTANVNVDTVFSLLKTCGSTLCGFMYTGTQKLSKNFWTGCLPNMPDLRILAMGYPYQSLRNPHHRISIDIIMETLGIECQMLERLEIQWDSDQLQRSETSSKYVDHLRLRCYKLRSLTLCDGEYFELVRSNFERAGHSNVVRTCTHYHTSVASLLSHYRELQFN